MSISDYMKFDENQQNILTQTEYLNHTNRLDGFQDLSESKLFNKILFQVSGVSKSFVKAVETINEEEINDLNNLYLVMKKVLESVITINLKREAQGKFRYIIIKAEINEASCKHAFMNGITKLELENSYGLGYALALYAGYYNNISKKDDFDVLYSLDKLSEIKNSSKAMQIINNDSNLKVIWNKYTA